MQSPISLRENRKNFHRAKLIAAARREFLRRGIHKTEVVEIAKAAGLSRATFYKYFPSKEALVYLISAEIAALQDEHVADFLSIENWSHASIRLWLHKVFETWGHHEAMARVILREMPDQFYTAFRARISLCADTLAANGEWADLAPDEARCRAYLLISQLQNFFATISYGSQALDRDCLLPLMTQLCLSTLGPQAQPHELQAAQ